MASTNRLGDRPGSGGFGRGPADPFSDVVEDLSGRLSAVERDTHEIKTVLGQLVPKIEGIASDVKALTKDVAELKGRVAHMPTLLSTGGVMLAINAGIVGVAALIIVLLRS